jgi:hypothetical protein
MVVAARVLANAVNQLNYRFGAGNRPLPENDVYAVAVFETSTKR